MIWLAAVENSGISSHPMIASINSDDPKENVWHVQGENCRYLSCNLCYLSVMCLFRMRGDSHEWLVSAHGPQSRGYRPNEVCCVELRA